MADLAEIEAAIAKAEKAGRSDLAAKLRVHADKLRGTAPEQARIDAAIAKAEAAGRKDLADKIRAAKGGEEQLTPPAPANPSGVDYPELMPPPADPNYRAPAATAPKPDTFGGTAGKMMEGPLGGAKAFLGGITGGSSPSRDFLAQDPLTKGLPDFALTGLGAIGDLGGAALSGIGAGLAGGIGLAAEAVPGQSDQDEKKLAEDLTGMAMFAVPELAGASSIIGKSATATVKVPQIGTKTWRNAYGVSEAKPTIESLRAAKNEAYKAVDEAGEAFDAPEMAALRDKVKTDLDAGNYVSGIDKQTDAVVSLLDRKAGEKMTLGQLDKLRQEFYKRLAAAPNEVGIRDAIDAIDEMIAGKADAGSLMEAARLSNSRYKKAELLDLAFQKAKDQTAATGSGGNILNKFRQAVVSIIDNPKNAKWFNADEITAMRSFVEGSTGQNAMRLMGKLSPNGNGLMLALNLGGAGASGGASLLLTGAAVGAKALADRAAIRGADALVGKVAGGAKATPKKPPSAPAKTVPVPIAPTAGQAANTPGSPEYEALWGRYGQ
jgi:hypothetical protein